MTPGSIVRCRDREWVLLPSDQLDLFLLRPLTGATDQVVAVHKNLSNLLGYSFPEERLSQATFPQPSPEDLSNAAGALLLWQAARLTLRDGAAPLRSLGRVSIRPRTYQFVPLLMALRLDPVRMLIADDVGVGKTIEALLVARELWDRGEIRRLAVLCPPYLCDQWQKELSEKFNLDAVLIRSGTVNQLERRIPRGGDSLFGYYPVQVVSIDFVKGDRKRDNFLQHCPDFVIVDEVHGAAQADPSNPSQQQRHRLLCALAADPNRHLVLLTATPHSGISEAFSSLLGLLHPDFRAWNVSRLSEDQRIRLARHFVQRTRKDIEANWEADLCFPKRVLLDEPYSLSRPYRMLFERTYQFCTEMVRTGQSLDQRRQRVRYWGALALLRCVMSSPAAATAALDRRSGELPPMEDEVEFGDTIFESSDEPTNDSPPTPPIESAEQTLPDTERRKLRELSRLARALAHTAEDTKLSECIKLVGRLLREDFHPIVWCRYIATADYVAQGLQQALASEFPDARVLAITGILSDDERRAKVEELSREHRRVLVATDCLSEGINLQHAFNAAIHYDLPWNPNRLEQREGRVDRYGQTAPQVKTIRFFSPDNPVDGVVIRVLLDKAREIHLALGTHVPVPEDSETVTQAVLNALFFGGAQGSHPAPQMELGLEVPEVRSLHQRWGQEAQREKENRTRFAQRALKPDEVRRELEATDAVLGDPETVRQFVLEAAQRLGLVVVPDRRPHVYRVTVTPEARQILPEAIQAVLPDARSTRSGSWCISFVSPTPENAEYLGRNHRFVAALAQFLLEEALTRGSEARASRCGALRTRAVARLTTLYLLRCRFLIEQPDRAPLLAEEVQVVGHTGTADYPTWLDPSQVLKLLTEAQPDTNIPNQERRELVGAALAGWDKLDAAWRDLLTRRAAELTQSHRRLRHALSLKVRGLTLQPQFPPDLLGLLVLQPLVEEGRREKGEGR